MVGEQLMCARVAAEKVLWNLLKLLLLPQWESCVELIHRVTSERSLLGIVPDTIRISTSCHF